MPLTAHRLVYLLLIAHATLADKSGFCHLFYVNADTDLEMYQVEDMQEVLQLHDSTFTALLYMDRNDGKTSNTDKPMQNLYYSNGQPTTAEISTSIYAKMQAESHTADFFWKSTNVWVIQKEPEGELDTDAVGTVLAFVHWAWGECSTSQYKAISFNMHGGGVSGVKADETNGHSTLSILELQTIFHNLDAEGMRFDIIGFDTCLMSAYSLGQVLHPLADYLVASEPTEPGYGWNYAGINTRASTPLMYSNSIVDAFLAQDHGPNELVVTDLQEFGKIVVPFKTLMVKLKNALLAGDQQLLDSITRARENSAEYDAIWEVFVDWFEIDDISGAKEKSQMDLGSFWRHLKVMCPALDADIDPLIAGLNSAVKYKKEGAGQTVCTGPGCAPGATGIALWFKKRRWMLGAYKYYEEKWGVSKKIVIRNVGPFVDSRLEKEIKEGLPDWYEFLSAFYTFEPQPTSVNTCGSALGTQPNSPANVAVTTDNSVVAEYRCPDNVGLCNVEITKNISPLDTAFTGDIAKWVTAIDLYIGTSDKADGENDIAWTMRLPTLFTSSSTFRSRWPSVIPYVVSADDECQAFLRVDGAVDSFSSDADCTRANVTLQLPVKYSASKEEVSTGMYQNAFLEQVVRCSGFSPVTALTLKTPASHNMYLKSVPMSAGGYIQPLINYGPTTTLEDANFKNCNSQAPFPWRNGVVINMVDVYETKMRENIDFVYGSLVTNTPVASDGNSELEKYHYNFKIDLASGTVIPEKLTPGSGSIVWYVGAGGLSLLLCAILGFAAFAFLKKSGKPPRATDEELEVDGESEASESASES